MKHAHVTFIIIILIVFFTLTAFSATKHATPTTSLMASITSNKGVFTSIDNVISISASRVLLSGSIKLEPVKIESDITPLKDTEFFNTIPGYYLSNLVSFNDTVLKKPLPSVLSLNYSIFGYISMGEVDIQTEDKSLNSMLFINDDRSGELSLEYQEIPTEGKNLDSMLFLNFDKSNEYPMEYANILTQTLKSTPSTKKTKNK